LAALARFELAERIVEAAVRRLVAVTLAGLRRPR
jgi:hypothetical protein